jgi:hypothetical protein
MQLISLCDYHATKFQQKKYMDDQLFKRFPVNKMNIFSCITQKGCCHAIILLSTFKFYRNFLFKNSHCNTRSIT